MVFEVVLENYDEAKIADQYGAKRIELCSGLDLGGLTPSYAIIEKCIESISSEVHTMIRPRAGGFIYNNNEINIMKNDIRHCSKIGCKGVVFGVLDNENKIDEYNSELLIEFSRSLGLEVTFHRALDFTDNIFKSIDKLIELNFTRILTSGGAINVDEGLNNLLKICNSYQNEIQIMAGGGVNINNASQLINLGIDSIHFNIRKEKENQSNILMGKEYEIDESKIINIKNLVDNYKIQTQQNDKK